MKVLIFGTFDVLHPGHLSYFRQARTFGDHITCVIARDKTVERIKGNAPRHSEEDRLQTVKNLGVLDEVVLGDLDDPFVVLDKYKPDVICIGYDQVSFTDQLQDKLLERGLKTKVIRLKPYKEDKYKSSRLADGNTSS